MLRKSSRAVSSSETTRRSVASANSTRRQSFRILPFFFRDRHVNDELLKLVKIKGMKFDSSSLADHLRSPALGERTCVISPFLAQVFRKGDPVGIRHESDQEIAAGSGARGFADLPGARRHRRIDDEARRQPLSHEVFQRVSRRQHQGSGAALRVPSCRSLPANSRMLRHRPCPRCEWSWRHLLDRG